MELDQYVVARRSRLIEYAVELGAAPEGAAALVDRVLGEQQRAIGQSEDPDPAVREALRVAVHGRARRSVLAPLAGLALVVLLAVAVVRFVGFEPAMTPLVPSTYTLDASSATTTLTDAGYTVERREVERCESPGLVITTEPVAGTPAAAGATVTLLVARPPGLSCPPGAGFRSQVWQFLRWVRGYGPPPPLVERPTIVTIDAAGARTVQVERENLAALIADEGADEGADENPLAALRAVVDEVPALGQGFPELIVRNGVVDLPCGATPPAGYDSLLTVRFDLAAAADEDGEGDGDGCPLTGYLIFANDQIDTIAILTDP